MFTLQSQFENKHQILEQGFDLYKTAFTSTLPYAFFATILIFAPHFFGIFNPLNTPHLENLNGFFCLMAICWLLGFVLITAMIFRLYCICYNVPSSFMLSIRHALYKFIPLLLLAAMYAIIVLSGTMLLIIPGLILSVSLMFSFILMITGNQNVLQTLTLSHRLVWGHWWHTVTIMAIPFLLNVTISLAVFVVIVGILIKRGFTPHDLYIYLFFAHIIIQALFMPFLFCVSLILLQDLKHKSFRHS